MKHITVPDIGDFKNLPVIEVLVAVGESIATDQPMVVVESDKATMEIPSPEAGLVAAIEVKVGDRISAGSLVLTLVGTPAAPAPIQPAPTKSMPAPVPAPVAVPTEVVIIAVAPPAPTTPSSAVASDAAVYAGPAVRKLAREVGVNLAEVKGSGPHGRIATADIHRHVKAALTGRSSGTGTAMDNAPFALLPWPRVDFAEFGPIDQRPLSRIQKMSGANLHRNWVMIPHVTNHDDADVTELEAFRVELNRDSEKNGAKVSPLAFIMKACVAALKMFTDFNASLDGETLILKRYYHIGFAADTPNGLVVPVIRDADRKGVLQIAQEMAELSGKARAGKLARADMQGGSFSISSLGGIGGSYFTPIINAPEVAILGVGKAQTRVVWADGQATPRLYLPLSLSWDHRVIDGAAAGRFNAHLVKTLGDVRRLLL